MSMDTHQKRSSGTNINLEETAEADNIDRRKDKRRHSSGSSTSSAGSGRKKHKLGSINEEDTDRESTEDEKEWSEEEFLFSYNDAPEWGKGLISFMKSSIKSIKISTRSMSSELQKVKNQQNASEKRMDDMEKAMQYVSDKKAVLLEQINDLRARYDLKCDEIEQYRCRLCLVLRGGGEGGRWKRKAIKTLINW